MSAELKGKENNKDWYEERGRRLHVNLLKLLRELGIDDRVVEAMGKVKRHEFVDSKYKEEAYKDMVIPHILEKTTKKEENEFDELVITKDYAKTLNNLEILTISKFLSFSSNETESSASQPYVVGVMSQSVLGPESLSNQVAVEIGAGTGYQMAVLSELGFGRVLGAEIYTDLIKTGNENLEKGGYDNCLIKPMDGIQLLEFLGRESVDAILVTAGITEDRAEEMFEFLKDKGRLVAPIMTQNIKREFKLDIIEFEYHSRKMEIRKHTRKGNDIVTEMVLPDVRFVLYQQD